MDASVFGTVLRREHAAAGVVLAVMIVPFIISVSREVMLAVPEGSARSGAGAGRDALGDHLGRGGAVTRSKGIIGSIFLALARALGETMAVTMVIGNDPKITLRCWLRAIPWRR